MQDILNSLENALVRQGWLYGQRMNRMGNPFRWVDGERIPELAEYRGVVSVLQYLAMSGEIYQTPAAIRTPDHDAVEARLVSELSARPVHLDIGPGLGAGESGEWLMR